MIQKSIDENNNGSDHNESIDDIKKTSTNDTKYDKMKDFEDDLNDDNDIYDSSDDDDNIYDSNNDNDLIAVMAVMFMTAMMMPMTFMIAMMIIM